MKNVHFISLVLCVILTGCGKETESISNMPVPQNVSQGLPAVNAVQGVAYEFQTAKGEYVTVVQDMSDDVSYKVPSEILDSRTISTPIQIHKGNYVLDIGYAGEELGSDVNANVFGTIYGEVVNQYLSKISDISDEMKGLLLNYTSAYPNRVYKSNIGFAGKNVNDTLWSDSIVDLTQYSLIKPFNLPVVTCTTRLESGEYLIAHCYASLQSGAWAMDSIPAYMDVVTNKEFINTTEDKYLPYIQDMRQAYKECTHFMQNELQNIHIGDLSDKYTIVSLSNTTNENYTYGIDVSSYDSYAFVVLEDSTVYLCYRKNNMAAYECIAGDATHNIQVNWNTADMNLIDLDTGNTYPFAWKTPS